MIHINLIGALTIILKIHGLNLITWFLYLLRSNHIPVYICDSDFDDDGEIANNISFNTIQNGN